MTNFCVNNRINHTQDVHSGSTTKPKEYFEAIFHWSENIEHRSPWVKDRSIEIANYVNGLFETKERETSKSGSNDVSKDIETEVVSEDCGETDDNITYEVASRLCDALVKQNETKKSERNPCSPDEHLKWTHLYQKLVKYERFNKCNYS